MNDPIVDEVRKVRDEYAARFNYDLDAMIADLREQEKRSGQTFLNPKEIPVAKEEAVEVVPIAGSARSAPLNLPHPAEN